MAVRVVEDREAPWLPRSSLAANLQRAVLRHVDTREIREGARAIHSLFHLDQPTVTIVVRTIAGPGEAQYNFHKPGLAHNPFFRSIRATRLVESLRFLHELRHPELVEEDPRLG